MLSIQKQKSKTLQIEQYVSNQQITGRHYKNFYWQMQLTLLQNGGLNLTSVHLKW